MDIQRTMSIFDFVVDKDLRASLQSDWKELQVAYEHSAWKAVHVLAGSIVEAILVDHLLSIRYKQKNPLKMSLDDAITASKAEGILSDKTAELSTVIRRFRNLIHPGRALRLSEVTDVHGATVSQSLVQMISAEIAKAKKETYGYTAEQISSKVERDGSAVAILPHLLKKTNAGEIKRLLLEVLPERYYWHELEDESDACVATIEKLFHAAFDVAEPDTKKAVARRFVKVLHEDDEQTVCTYERVFFRAGHLAFLDPDDTRVIREHLVAQLKTSPSVGLFEAALGVGKYLDLSEIGSFVDVAVQVIIDSKKFPMHSVCERFITDLFHTLPVGPNQRVNLRLEQWARFLKQRNRDEDAQRVEGIILISDDEPF